MIKDKLENAQIYFNISENLKKGFEWLCREDLSDLADGKYEIKGQEVYASVQTYETKDDANYESHRSYIDIQYMIKGVEKIGVTDVKNCVTCIDYDADRDLEFYKTKCDDEYFDLPEGYFMVFFPHDAHKPSIKKDISRTVKKVVVKVKL